MGSVGYGKRKGPRRAVGMSLKGMTRRCSGIFLDSGAHSLYSAHARSESGPDVYDWFVRPDGKFTKRFRRYLDEYAGFIKRHKSGLDHYATVDVIYNPEVSWQSLKYLENEHGLKPIPVIHSRTELKWVQKHLDAGYTYIGLGGLGQKTTKQRYLRWADSVFKLICPSPKHLPLVKVHGFAMSAYSLMVRYPWYSVDSVSWAKAAGFGSVLVPHKRNGEFTFEVDPYVISASNSSPHTSTSRHYNSLTPLQKSVVLEWFESIDIPLGKTDPLSDETIEYGILSEYNARAVANLRFFTRLCEWLPEYPWAFEPKYQDEVFFEDAEI